MKIFLLQVFLALVAMVAAQGVQIADNNPEQDVIDPGFYRPGNGDVIDPGFYRPGRPIDGSELIDKEPLIIDPPYRPRFPADQPYLRGGK
ncbi:hypothetical protein KGM_210453 [Danaus plexippus plexippus]|uniref:Seminal fluid protein n=1 Tax=Danaus plexippus plexippus TaxID=278856 RepID=A0A212EPS9_DANPL|nr:hypothetical protein KGM_210453 [Danaus plexippus plexippus]